MSFPGKLVLTGIFLLLFVIGFGYFQSIRHLPDPIPMIICLLVMAIVGVFLYRLQSSGH